MEVAMVSDDDEIENEFNGMFEQATIEETRDKYRAGLSQHENHMLALLEQTPGDGRWKSIARTHLEQGFMAWKRAVYEGKRVGD
jgi:hypothetical protein